MKKTLLRTLTMALLIVMVVSVLASCSSMGSISKRFVKDGYEEVELDSEAKQISAAFEKGSISATVHLFQKPGTLTKISVIIVEFETDKELVEALDGNETLKGMVKDSQKSDIVNGNCLLVPTLTSLAHWDDVKTLFKG